MSTGEEKKKKRKKQGRNLALMRLEPPQADAVESDRERERVEGGASMKGEGQAPDHATVHPHSHSHSPLHALAVDPEIRDKNLKRLRRIEGQVRGLQRMVEEDLYCADIMTQIASVQEALRSVGRELVRNHMKHCASAAIRSDDPKRGEAMYEELLDMVYRLGR